MVDRKGGIHTVSVGTAYDIDFPHETRLRSMATRLSGFRLIYTNLSQSRFSMKELNALENRRLDMIATIDTSGSNPGNIRIAHLKPEPSGKDSIIQMDPIHYLELDLPFNELVESLEAEFKRILTPQYLITDEKRAILCIIDTGKKTIDEEIQETLELCKTAGLAVVDTVIQAKDRPDPKYGFGKGKLKTLIQKVVQHDADIVLFHNNLSPTQFRVIGDEIQTGVIDRTQLILDIFAQHAKSHEGKLQVEVAQLKYTIPRLREKNTQMSRLTGGIGGRGPGETKLEIHRRRAKEKIQKLEKDLKQIKERRFVKRKARNKKGVPIVSIIGYTNAGKSTLLNTLTQSKVIAEDKLFATLDPYSKMLRFPLNKEIILTDTVGFIRDLPPELLQSFEATLEEVHDADLLIHLIDIGNQSFEDHIEVVDQLLAKLEMNNIPQIKVFNKMENVEPEFAERTVRKFGGIAITAMDKKTLRPLIEMVQEKLFPGSSTTIIEPDSLITADLD
jgi:GTP-binding protein HflX